MGDADFLISEHSTLRQSRAQSAVWGEKSRNLVPARL